jgi:hypothetical protein
VAHDARDEEIAGLKRQLAAVIAENAALREENARLRKELEEWKRGHRERSKRRTSRAEGRREASGKKPGRKPGHAGAFRPVPKPDRSVQYPVPQRCSCGGCVDPTGETDRTIVQDIPAPVRPENVEHVAHVGRCRRCNKRVRARLPGSVENGESVCEVQLGPNVQALIIDLRYELKVPLGGISAILGRWFSIDVTPGGISHLIGRLRERSTASYTEIERRIQASPVVGIDETGLRQDGVSGWAWLARTDEASLFRVELSRGGWVAEAMLGKNFAGIVCSDFYGVYTGREDWQHAYCGAHVVRDAKKIAEVSPGLFTETFRDEISDWYAVAKTVQGGSAYARSKMKRELEDILDRPFYEHPDVLRLCARLTEHFDGVVSFLDHPDVKADNNDTERDVRPLAVYRKISGGTRSPKGSKNLGHWMSITQTLRKNGRSLSAYINGLWRSHLRGRAPPSVFAAN